MVAAAEDASGAARKVPLALALPMPPLFTPKISATQEGVNGAVKRRESQRLRQQGTGRSRAWSWAAEWGQEVLEGDDERAGGGLRGQEEERKNDRGGGG